MINFNELSTMKNIVFKKYNCILLIDIELKIVSDLFQKNRTLFQKIVLEFKYITIFASNKINKI